jgi:hypothetical protein
VTHEYPPNRTFNSVSISRVSPLRDGDLTPRQRSFLATVMVHSGCFLERQYCEFTGTVRGQNSREFVVRLVARGFARAIEPGPARRGRLYHVHHKPLYEAIGQADNRNRRLRTIGRMVERVMILDAVLGDRRCWWLSPEPPRNQISRMVSERETGREPFVGRTASNDRQGLFPPWNDQQRVVSAEWRPIPQTATDRLSECERSHLTRRRCEVCAREFVPKRRWQRGCGSPACRSSSGFSGDRL